MSGAGPGTPGPAGTPGVLAGSPEATSVRLWLVRHGETEWARDGRHTGRTDVPLTDRGREQAAALRERLASERFVAVRCSPLSRARETLEIAVPGTRPTLDDDLMERDYGVAEGRTTAELREEQPGWTSWTAQTPGAETIDEVGVRTDRAIARAVAAGRHAAPDDGCSAHETPGGAVLVVAHGHLLRVLAARWLEQPAGFGAQLVLGTASLSILGSERGRPALVRWNT
ncbi:histidine phosphatase family protein [Patulibacter sp.]|uniref:histidine phosphatase family protein n=1 Tax=Patulibacter sp. TaxID=1912859 RepID=UPI00272189DB|nr:histidine phosphatase family protein [Patulibacter sp.]MDO9408096.1 histidine phosphatase family protein [Patulibacter sp.]